jgi:hypothetical protein
LKRVAINVETFPREYIQTSEAPRRVLGEQQRLPVRRPVTHNWKTRDSSQHLCTADVVGFRPIAPDGQRFLTFIPRSVGGAAELRIVLNWFEELERLAPHPH